MTTTPDGVVFQHDTTVFTPTDPKWPDLELPLIGEDGNAFSILARLDRVLRRGVRDGILTDEERTAALAQARDGDYDHLLWFVQCLVSTS